MRLTNWYFHNLEDHIWIWDSVTEPSSSRRASLSMLSFHFAPPTPFLSLRTCEWILKLFWTPETPTPWDYAQQQHSLPSEERAGLESRLGAIWLGSTAVRFPENASGRHFSLAVQGNHIHIFPKCLLYRSENWPPCDMASDCLSLALYRMCSSLTLTVI